MLSTGKGDNHTLEVIAEKPIGEKTLHIKTGHLTGTKKIPCFTVAELVILDCLDFCAIFLDE